MLKNILVIGIALGLPLSAAAESYTAAVEKQSKCQAAGELSRSFFGATREHLQAEAKKVQAQEKAKKISKELSADTVFLMYIGYKATSAQGAYMKGWAACMDQK